MVCQFAKPAVYHDVDWSTQFTEKRAETLLKAPAREFRLSRCFKGKKKPILPCVNLGWGWGGGRTVVAKDLNWEVGGL